ncbi:MAG: NADP-dependent malic enzyme [Acetobacterales bacterium]
MSDSFRDSALDYHRLPQPGKLAIAPTKPLANQLDLSLAYSPGVGYACEAIAADPATAADYTARGNLVAVVSNGTAVLGLGSIGPLAAKPVMEGKAVLFKKFAGIDVFDLEVDALEPERLIDIVASLEPTFGGINLEDIKAPECFLVEERLRARMNIPVFHDDQHGTAIIVGAAVRNALQLVGKRIGDVRLVACGVGSAGIACLNLLCSMGLRRENVTAVDIDGVIHAGRTFNMDPYKAAFARNTEARTLGEVIGGADIFLGLSAPGVLTPDMVRGMAERPLILALANPEPEIRPEVAREVRPDAIIATGRSDYPNQVNNVLCFPFIFRGALDVGATTVNEEMKLACVDALSDLAQREVSDVVQTAYGGDANAFGPDYIIPRPFDPRLIGVLAPAVARAAMDSGVASRPLEDIEAYRTGLDRYVWRSGLVMRPVFDEARRDPRRVVYAEGDEPRVLRAAQVVVDEGLARPVLIGRQEVIEDRIGRYGLRLQVGRDVELLDPKSYPRYDDYWRGYHALLSRRGVTPAAARAVLRSRATAIGAMMVRKGDADALICGSVGRYVRHLESVADVIGCADGVSRLSALAMLIVQEGPLFICDPFVNEDPGVEDIVEQTLLAAEEVRRLGVEPKIALLSHSNFGSRDTGSALKMREALALLRERAPGLEVDGEMHADYALSPELRAQAVSDCRLSGAANLLILPSLDAANIGYNLVKATAGAQPVGPMLLGTARPAHVVTPAVTVRGLVNITALAVVDAQDAGEDCQHV